MQWSVLLPVVLTLIATHDGNSKAVDVIADLCYTKWALEAFVVSNAKRFALNIRTPPLSFQSEVLMIMVHILSVCFQIFWSVANNPMWFTFAKWV